MPRIDQPHQRRLTIFVICGVLASFVAGGEFAFRVYQKASAANYTTVTATAKALDEQNQYATEVKVLNKFLATKPPTQYGYLILCRLGLLELREHMYQVSESDYRRAEVLSGREQLPDIEGIAVVAEASGDKRTAIEYYRKAIQLLDAHPSQNSLAIDEDASAIRALGGTP
jgi:tetratricopeptide (TPR) repeat protein